MFHRRSPATDQILSIAATVEADPLWQLSERTFNALADQGRSPADLRTDDEVIDAVIAGTKPAGLIDGSRISEPETQETLAERAVNAGLAVVYQNLETGSNGRRFAIARKTSDLHELRRGLALPEPLRSVTVGRALGYEDKDIAAFLRSMGGRRHGRKLVAMLSASQASFQFNLTNKNFLLGWEPYRPLDAAERAGAAKRPPKPYEFGVDIGPSTDRSTDQGRGAA